MGADRIGLGVVRGVVAADCVGVVPELGDADADLVVIAHRIARFGIEPDAVVAAHRVAAVAADTVLESNRAAETAGYRIFVAKSRAAAACGVVRVAERAGIGPIHLVAFADCTGIACHSFVVIAKGTALGTRGGVSETERAGIGVVGLVAVADCACIDAQGVRVVEGSKGIAELTERLVVGANSAALTAGIAAFEEPTAVASVFFALLLLPNALEPA